jgi:hypothetical protein
MINRPASPRNLASRVDNKLLNDTIKIYRSLRTYITIIFVIDFIIFPHLWKMFLKKSFKVLRY